ncbi:DUF4012 domain-containing protein [Microbacterium sp. P01]|uniref:DUF4012 domain-containing protein n=1 Tax=unclassified Microbacterium TaxID=2609290 RepID=UPI00366BE2BD
MSEPVLPRPARTAGVVFAWVLAALVLLSIFVVAWVGIRGFLAYGHLTDAQSRAASVRADLTDPTTVATALADLSADTQQAHALTSDPIWRAAEGLPWVGPQLAAVSTVAGALDEVASTALAPLAQVASTFSVDALRPQNGRIDLTSFQSVQDAATTGTRSLGQAAASIDAIDRAPLVSPLRDAVNQVDDLLAQTESATGALARATALLPAMLGADGPRDYLVLFQNNAELRSLGGNPGAMALIHTDGGTMTLTAQDSTSGFPKYPESVIPLSEEVRALYGDRPGEWMQNTTLVPDFTVAAEAARAMWAREHDGLEVDGVLSIDPVALSYLLAATGPVTLPTGDVLTPDNAVQLLLNEVYLRYERPADQDAFFAAAASGIFTALSSGNVDPVTLLTALARAGDEDRLLIWSARDDDQALLADTTLAGGLPVTDRDASTFGVYLNDGTGSKMDYYLGVDTQVQWTTCVPASDRTATGQAQLALTLTNNAPADSASLPDYITGGGTFGVPPGTIRTVGYIYLPEGFDLVDADVTGTPGFGGGFHDGRQVLSFSVDLVPGASATATATVQTTAPSSTTMIARTTPTVNTTDTQSLVAVCETP